MKILHIAKITNKKTSGVNVVVPQHILAQSKNENTYFWNINSVVIPELDKNQIYLKLTKELVSDIQKQIGKIDIVIFHEVNNIENISVYKQLLKSRIPYIIVPHGEITQLALTQKKMKKKLAYICLFNKFIRQSNAVQCLSEREAQEIKIRTSPKFIVGNGVPKASIIKKTFNQDKVTLSYVGRLDYQHKGLDLLIQAISEIKDYLKLQNAEVHLYGPNVENYVDQINSFIKKYKVEQVVFLHDPVFEKEKEKVYLSSDLFIQTSRYEGLPTGILEALGVGLPCIVTNGTNLSQLIEEYEAGYNAGGTVESIKEAIVKAIDDRDNWIIKGKNGVKLIENKYLWDNIALNEIEQYKKILASVVNSSGRKD